MSDRFMRQEESVAARRVLARMAVSSSAQRAEKREDFAASTPASSGSAVIAPSAPSSPLSILLASRTHIPERTDGRGPPVGSLILGPRRVIIAAVVPLLRAVIGRAMQDPAVR